MEELVQMSSSSDDEEYSSLAEEVPFIAGLVLLGFLCLRNVINKGTSRTSCCSIQSTTITRLAFIRSLMPQDST